MSVGGRDSSSSCGEQCSSIVVSVMSDKCIQQFPFVQDACVKKLARMTPEARLKAYTALIEYEVDFPLNWKLAVFGIFIQEQLERKDIFESDVLQVLAAKLVPTDKIPDKSKFDVLDPAFPPLQHKGVADTASMLVKLVAESLLPLLNAGELSLDRVCAWTSELARTFRKATFSCQSCAQPRPRF